MDFLEEQKYQEQSNKTEIRDGTSWTETTDMATAGDHRKFKFCSSACKRKMVKLNRRVGLTDFEIKSVTTS